MKSRVEEILKYGCKTSSMYIPDTVVTEATAEDEAYHCMIVEGLKTRKTPKTAFTRKPSDMDFEDLFDAYSLIVEI